MGDLAHCLDVEADRRSGLLTREVTAVDSALASVRRVLPSALSHRRESLLATARYTTPGRPASAADEGDECRVP